MLEDGIPKAMADATVACLYSQLMVKSRSVPFIARAIHAACSAILLANRKKETEVSR